MHSDFLCHHSVSTVASLLRESCDAVMHFRKSQDSTLLQVMQDILYAASGKVYWCYNKVLKYTQVARLETFQPPFYNTINYG